MSSPRRRDGSPESRVFFVDRSLEGRLVIDALRGAGALVEPHRDHFAHDERDEVWLADVGRRGWIVLTKDRQIRTRIMERQALLASGVRAFILTAGNLRGVEMAELLVRHLPAIRRMAQRTPPPFIAAVTRSDVHLYASPDPG